jgi:hypothetical protein
MVTPKVTEAKRGTATVLVNPKTGAVRLVWSS